MSESLRVDEATGCHLWIKGVDSQGYGHARWNGLRRKAHVFAFELAGNTLPDGQLLRHTCNNRTCCNPSHLLVGTHGENAADRAKSGIVSGENNPQATLSNETALAIYSASGQKSPLEVGQLHQTSVVAVRNIWSGRTYRSVTNAPLVRTGRLRGSDNPSAILSDDDAIVIFRAKTEGRLCRAALAKAYGVTWTTINNIWEGLTHSHITGCPRKERQRNRKTMACRHCQKVIQFAWTRQKCCSIGCALWVNVARGETTNCWPWTAKSKSTNYGSVRFGGTRAMAHVVAFDEAYPDLAVVRVSKALTVSHTCHNSLCCNPSHLTLMTLEEGSRDNAGRLDLCGENNPHSILTEEAALTIVRLLGLKACFKDIIATVKATYEIEIKDYHIADIKRGKTWAYLAGGLVSPQ